MISRSSILATCIRGHGVETIHRGHIIIVDNQGRVVFAQGNPGFKTFVRSGAKPFQLIPVIETGAYDRYQFSRRELAIMMASHSGEPSHIRTLQGVLRKIKVKESSLKCGIHPPIHYQSMRNLFLRKEKLTPLYNNCSGKHAAMLAICKHKGWPIKDYDKPSHPVQKLLYKYIKAGFKLTDREVSHGIDGCGVPVYAFPLKKMAWGYARLVAGEVEGVDYTTTKIICSAMTRNPFIVAGTGRIDSLLMSCSLGKIISKSGAEGLLCVGFVYRKLGMVIKIDDGSSRALPVIVLELMKKLGFLTTVEQEMLVKYIDSNLRNHRGEIVGEIVPHIER